MEDHKRWLEGTENKERAQEKGEHRFEGIGDTWRILLKLAQHVWDTGEIPCWMLLTIVILILKRNSEEYSDIGLLEARGGVKVI